MKKTSWLATALVVVTSMATLAPGTSVAAASSRVNEAQTIMKKFGIPTGPVDGYYGPQTGRGLCAFRYLAGQEASRANVSDNLMAKLRQYNGQYRRLTDIPAPRKDGQQTYLLVNETCQVMFYVENGRYQRVMAVSTGRAGYGTPNGTYWLGGTEKGWSCSTSYPESCRHQSTGKFTKVSDFGNMYNKRYFTGSGYYVHGSMFVPPYPDSHGCVRVTVKDADWMQAHVGNSGRTYLAIVGGY